MPTSRCAESVRREALRTLRLVCAFAFAREYTPDGDPANPFVIDAKVALSNYADLKSRHLGMSGRLMQIVRTGLTGDALLYCREGEGTPAKSFFFCPEHLVQTRTGLSVVRAFTGECRRCQFLVA